MSEAKLAVIYPRPKDLESFEKIYLTEHVPMAVEKLVGKTKIVATKITGSPQGVPPFYRIVEVYFLSIAALDVRCDVRRTGDFGARCKDLNRWNSNDTDR